MIDLHGTFSYVCRMFHRPEAALRLTLLFLTILNVCASHLAPAQHSLSRQSLLLDPAYMRDSIRQISDRGLWQSLDLGSRALAAVRKATDGGDFGRAAAAWGKYWTGKTQPAYVTRTDHLFLDTDMLMTHETFRGEIRASPVERDTILVRAENIMRHIIRTWGDSVIDFGARVNFDRDIGQSGIYGFHYWYWSRPLVMAAVFTGDRKYTAKFDELFNLWYDQRNMIHRTIPDFDVVYYELGLGTRNRLFIENYLLPLPGRTPATHERMLKTVLAAARWLYQLELWEGYRPGNWQVHGSYMLTQIALAFPEFRESSGWLALGLKRMVEHLDEDFFPDGGHSERCPHNYTQATYLNFRNLAYLLKVYGTVGDVREKIRASLGRTIDWWIAMLCPTGEVPAINDSQRGLFPASIFRDGAELFGKRDGYGILRTLFGDSTAMEATLPSFTSRHLPASGFTVMRTDWSPRAHYLVMNYGPAAGFHTHFDLLDFELYGYGKPLAVDAGIGMTYDDPLYNSWYRSSRAHNMVVVNDSNCEREGMRGKNILWGSTAGLDYFSGDQDGYRRFGVHQRRQVVFVKPSYWFILDDLTCARAGDTLSWYFHSPEDLLPTDDGFVTATAPGLHVIPVGLSRTVRTGEGRAAVSGRSPGQTARAPWIRFDQTGSRDTLRQFPVLLVPFERSPLPMRASRVSERHFRVHSPDATEDLYFADGGFSDDIVQTDARFLLVRSHPPGATSFAVIQGTYFRYRGMNVWTCPARASGEGSFGR